jgi:hypothetical protein
MYIRKIHTYGYMSVRYGHETHARENTPMRYTSMRCTPVRYTPVRYRCILMNLALLPPVCSDHSARKTGFGLPRLHCFQPTPQLFLFGSTGLATTGNRPEMKYSVSVPDVPGRNYRDSSTVRDFSIPTLHTECLGSQSLWKMKITLGEHIKLPASQRR